MIILRLFMFFGGISLVLAEDSIGFFLLGIILIVLSFFGITIRKATNEDYKP